MTALQPELQSSFHGSTGKNIRIAVIDSGVNLRHPHIHASTEGVALWADEPDTEDRIGHGTAVTAAIQEKAPGAHYCAVKLFGPSLRTRAGRLLEAIEWTLDNQIDIVNLSLGTTNPAYKDDLEALMSRLTDAGVLVVSARTAGDRPALPGSLPGVIGVEADWEISRNRYRIQDENGAYIFWASGYPRSLPGVPPSRNLQGISFAVANMTGFVACALEGTTVRSFPEVCALLAAESERLQSLQ
jgi:subtilisin family serine protease